MRFDTGIVIPTVILVLGIALLVWLLSGTWLFGRADGADTVSIPLLRVEQGGMDRTVAADPWSPLGRTRPATAAQPSSSQQVAQAEDPAAGVAARRDEIYNDPDSPVGGNPAGDVTVVEFFDYNCPYCREVAGVLGELRRIDSNVRFVFKEFPILGPNSDVAARAALAAHRQGKYLAFHDAMMTSGLIASEATVLQIADMVGLDIERLKTDMNDPTIAVAIVRNLALARALRIRATPSFVIADQVYTGAADLAGFQQVIAAERQRLAQ